jgi:thioredoxin-related protein
MHINRPRSLQLSRRALVGLSGAYLAAGLFPAKAAPPARAYGMYDETWFLKPSYDLSKDFAAAASANKTFAVIWEMPSCSWCRLLHAVNFAREDISTYAKQNFGFLQLNMTGGRRYADFDGEKLPERILALKHEVASTPTFQFFVPGGAEGPREVGRMAYREPDDFLHMLRFVREQRYLSGQSG